MHIDRTNAERQRRYYQRQKGELCPANIELPYATIIAMSEKGILPEGAASDPIERAKAIEQFLIKHFSAR